MTQIPILCISHRAGQCGYDCGCYHQACETKRNCFTNHLHFFTVSIYTLYHLRAIHLRAIHLRAIHLRAIRAIIELIIPCPLNMPFGGLRLCGLFRFPAAGSRKPPPPSPALCNRKRLLLPAAASTTATSRLLPAACCLLPLLRSLPRTPSPSARQM